jgi:hypothetical protein
MRLPFLSSIAALCIVTAAGAAGSAPELPPLPSDDVNARPVSAGVTYAAHSFPIALRITPPDGTWLAGQWSVATTKRGSFGYTEFMHGPPSAPNGAISMVTSPDPTPSVAASVAQLRGTAGVTYGPPTFVRLGGFSGSQFDAHVGPKARIFVPLSPPSHKAVYHPDGYRFDAGEVLRLIVLDVRGKTVVLLIENAALPAEQFPQFLGQAHALLASLRFPSA